MHWDDIGAHDVDVDDESRRIQVARYSYPAETTGATRDLQSTGRTWYARCPPGECGTLASVRLRQAELTSDECLPDAATVLRIAEGLTPGRREGDRPSARYPERHAVRPCRKSLST